MTLRVLHIAHQQLRKYGATRVSWGHKLDLGFIKAGYALDNFSDRDVTAFESPLGIRPIGRRIANRRLLQMVEATEPDLVLAGHCDKISNATLAEIRRMRPQVTLAHANCDPLFVPENVARIKHRAEVVDAIFVSTGQAELERIFTGCDARFYHMPNSVDATVERFDVSTVPHRPTDLLFCSKSNDYTKRRDLIRWLKDSLPETFKFRTPGYDEPGVWALDYERAIARSKMGLNLNRQEGHQWYSSDRMAHFGGNGSLVLTHRNNGFESLFPPETLVYFSTRNELLERLTEYHRDDAKRRTWAHNTHRFFHEHMNSTLHARYIVEASLQHPFSHAYVWDQGVS